MKHKIFHQLWPLLIIIIFSTLIVLFTEMSELEELLDYVFTHSVFVALFGIALTIYGLNYRSISKVKSEIKDKRDKSYRKNIDKNLKRASGILNSFYKESRENLIFVFFSLILSFIIISCKKIDIPALKLSIPGTLSRANIFNFISLFILFSTLYAVYDLLKALVLINGREFLN